MTPSADPPRVRSRSADTATDAPRSGVRRTPAGAGARRRRRRRRLVAGAARRRRGQQPRRPAPPAVRGRARRGAPPAPRAPATRASRLIELHAFNAAGDAAVAISLAGTLFFQVPTGRGARPGRAVPGPDDAAVRDRRAADRPVPRPVQPRPPLGRSGRRWRSAAFLCWVLATAVVDRVATGSSRRRSGCWSPPRRTASPARPRSPGCCRPTSPWSRPTPGSRSRASWAPASPHRSPSSPRPSARSGRCATRFLVFVLAHDLGDPAAAAGRRQPGRGRDGADRLDRRGRTGRRAAHPHPRRGRLRAAGNCGPAVALGLPDDVHGVPAARATRSASGGPRCCSGS